MATTQPARPLATPDREPVDFLRTVDHRRVHHRPAPSCQSEDPELFWPVGDSGPALVQTEEAKGICRTCPVRLACLRYATDTAQREGVWGGLSERERRNTRLVHQTLVLFASEGSR